jgi:SAM-dependent methyltransferase
MNDETIRRLNVGCGRSILQGWINLDRQLLPGVDVVADLDDCSVTPLPMESDSVDEFLLSHVIEHIRNPLPLMQELHRIARPDAKAVIRVPYGSSDGAWCDPTHVRPYFLGSVNYFSQPYYWRADYGYRGDWRPIETILTMQKGPYGDLTWPELMDKVNDGRNTVHEMICTLGAVKPIRAPLRNLQSWAKLRIEFF